ncbi:MAG TPA: hypothetical protein VGI87_06395 [Solirubrobacteraceae bacterium]
MREILDEFVAAGPALQRPALRALLTLARRPRGQALLASLPLAQQAADSLVAMAYYDDPARSRALGWDAEAVVRRGRELRHREGRP